MFVPGGQKIIMSLLRMCTKYNGWVQPVYATCWT